jgi:hypothetical protein
MLKWAVISVTGMLSTASFWDWARIAVSLDSRGLDNNSRLRPLFRAAFHPIKYVRIRRDHRGNCVTKGSLCNTKGNYHEVIHGH